MINAKRANALLWVGNVLLIIGIAVFGIQFLVIPRPRGETWEPPRPVPVNGLEERVDPAALASLPNPLSTPDSFTRSQAVLLIGIDAAGTAYLFMADRKLYVNAYVEEAIPELSGWRLKSVRSNGADFTTPQGVRTLELVQGPGLLATSALDRAVELLKLERVEEACLILEFELQQRPSPDAVYAFIQRAGEDVIASLMNSKDERARALGFRIFELAKAGGERRRVSNA